MTAGQAQLAAQTQDILNTMKSINRSFDSFAYRAPAPAAIEGYLGSSLDLQAGLRVRELMISACPPDVIRELARMRKAWATPATSAAA